MMKKKTEREIADRYSARVSWSASDDGYIAVCPELQSVSAYGDTAEEALQELRVAIEMTVETYQEEGWELPEPAGAKEYSGQFRLRVPKRLHQWLAETAEEEGISLNACVTMILSAARGESRAVQQYWTPRE